MWPVSPSSDPASDCLSAVKPGTNGFFDSRTSSLDFFHHQAAVFASYNVWCQTLEWQLSKKIFFWCFPLTESRKVSGLWERAQSIWSSSLLRPLVQWLWSQDLLPPLLPSVKSSPYRDGMAHVGLEEHCLAGWGPGALLLMVIWLE